MTFGILEGVFIGVGLSMLWLVAVSALPLIPELARRPGTQAFLDVDENPDGEKSPGLVILRFDNGLFFVNTGALEDRLRALRVELADNITGVVLSMEGVNFVDAEGADSIRKIAQAGLDQGIDFHLARVKPQVLEVLVRDGAVDVIGTDRIHDDIAAAVDLHERRHPAPSAQ